MDRRIMAKTLCSVTAIMLAAAAMPAGTVIDNVRYDIGINASAETISDGLELVDGVYEISNANGLEAFRDKINMMDSTGIKAKLINNIAFTKSSNFTPISDFKGEFDGNGKAVTYYVSSSNLFAGLFSSVTGGTVKNLTVAGEIASTYSIDMGAAYINFGQFGIGGICGKLDGGTIENCESKVTVTSGNVPAGGIAGYCSEGSKIKNCVNSGSVSAGWIAGGIVGGGYNDISDCANYGALSAPNYITGGIVGAAYGGEIKNCLSAGSFTTSQYSDSITSNPFYVSTITVTNCYTTEASKYSSNGAETIDSEQLSNGYASYNLGWNQDVNPAGGTTTKPSPLTAATDATNLVKIGFEDEDGTVADIFGNSIDGFEAAVLPESKLGFWVSEENKHSADYYQKNKAKFSSLSGAVFTDTFLGELTGRKMKLGAEGDYSIIINYTFDINEIAQAEGIANVNVNGEKVQLTNGVYSHAINVKNIIDDIEIKVGDATYNDSGKKYLEGIIDDTKGLATPEQKVVAEKLLDYAAQAQLVKGYKTSTLANADKNPDNYITDNTGKIESSFSYTKGEGGLTLEGANIEMTANHQLKVYFSLDEEAEASLPVAPIPGVSFSKVSINGSPALPITRATLTMKSGDWYYFTIPVSPASFDTTYTISFVDGEGNSTGDTLTYSVNDYLKRKAADSSDEKTQMLAAALYNYSVACTSVK